MDIMPTILILMITIMMIIILVGLILVLIIWKRKKEGTLKEPNYRAFYITGLIMLPIGAIFMITYLLLDILFITAMPFLTLGVVYLVIGLQNRDKWVVKK